MVHEDIDNGRALAQIRQVYAKAESTSDDVKKLVEDVEDSLNYTISTRKLAAQLGLRIGMVKKRTWLRLAAVVATGDAETLARVCRHWTKEVEQDHGVSTNDEACAFYTTFIPRIAKLKEKLRAELDETIWEALVWKCLTTSIILAETRSEDLSHLLKAVAKLVESQDQRAEMVDFLLIRSSPEKVLSSEMLQASILLSSADDEMSEYVFLVYLPKLGQLAFSQDEANAAAPLICWIIQTFAQDKRLEDTLMDCLTSPFSIIRGSVMRSWLGRCRLSEPIISLLTRILKRIEDYWNSSLQKTLHEISNPKPWLAQDVSCVDANWRWEEAPMPLWTADRNLLAWLDIYGLLARKAEKKEWGNKELLKVAMKWHLPEVRQMAHELYVMTVTNSNSDQWSESFILANTNSSNEELRSYIRRIAKTFKFSTFGKEAFEKKATRIYEPENRAQIYIPLESEIAVPAPPSSAEIPGRLVELLELGGSTSADPFPSIPSIRQRLEVAGVDDRIYTKMLADIMDTAVKELPRAEALEVVWKAVTRCRLKAVVDCGCDHVESILDKENASIYFNKALPALLSSTPSPRTACISRILLTCCSASSDLLSTLWESIQPFLQFDTASSVLSKILKTLKLFYSTSDFRFPDMATCKLFKFCIEAQAHEDFLVRSSATILFGFIVRACTVNKNRPLFVHLRTWSELWNYVASLSLGDLHPFQRVLVLSYLSQLVLANDEYYSYTELRSIVSLCKDVKKVWKCSKDVRERRFCIDVLLRFHMEWIICQEAEEGFQSTSTRSLNFQADIAYLESCRDDSPWSLRKSRIDLEDLEESLFVRLIQEAKDLAERKADEEALRAFMFRLNSNLTLSCEQNAQCAAVCLVVLADSYKKVVEKSNNLACGFFSEFSILWKLLISHEVRRVRSIAGVVAFALGWAKGLVHKHYLEEIIDEKSI